MQCESCLSLWCGHSQDMSDELAAVQEISRSVTTQPLGPSSGFDRAQGQPGNAVQPRLGGNSRLNLMDTARQDRGGTSMADTALREPPMWERPMMSSLMDSARSPWDFGRSGAPPSFPVSLSPPASWRCVTHERCLQQEMQAALPRQRTFSLLHQIGRLAPGHADLIPDQDPQKLSAGAGLQCSRQPAAPPAGQQRGSPAGAATKCSPGYGAPATLPAVWRAARIPVAAPRHGQHREPHGQPRPRRPCVCYLAVPPSQPGGQLACCPFETCAATGLWLLQDWVHSHGVFMAVFHTCDPVSMDEGCFVHGGPVVIARCLLCRRLRPRILQAARCRLLRPKRRSSRKESLRRPPPSRLPPRPPDQKNSAGRSLVQAPSRRFGAGARVLAHLGLNKWTTSSSSHFGV